VAQGITAEQTRLSNFVEYSLNATRTNLTHPQAHPKASGQIKKRDYLQVQGPAYASKIRGFSVLAHASFGSEKPDVSQMSLVHSSREHDAAGPNQGPDQRLHDAGINWHTPGL
jgi:hypothetical protein